MLEEEARAAGHQVEFRTGDMSGWYNLRRTNEAHGASKVIIDGDTDTILGAHLLGAQADEMINRFATAIRARTTTLELKTEIYVHPAATSDITYML